MTRLWLDYRGTDRNWIGLDPGCALCCCQALRCQKMDSAHVALHILALKTTAVLAGDGGFDFDSERDTL